MNTFMSVFKLSLITLVVSILILAEQVQNIGLVLNILGKFLDIYILQRWRIWSTDWDIQVNTQGTPLLHPQHGFTVIPTRDKLLIGILLMNYTPKKQYETTAHYIWLYGSGVTLLPIVKWSNHHVWLYQQVLWTYIIHFCEHFKEKRVIQK